MTDISLMQAAILLAGLCATAVLAGLLAGLLGVGGGIVLVPALFWLLSATHFPPEISMHMSVATSLATIIFTSLSSARAHQKRGAVDTGLLWLWGPGIVIGALTGGLVARYINADGLKAIFGGIALLVAVNMAAPRNLVLAAHLPVHRAANWAIASIVGLLSALMGIGGGTLSVPILTAFSVEIRRAVGTAAAFGFLIALPATIGFVASGWGLPGRPPVSVGYVSLLGAAVILPFSVGFAPFGAHLAHRLDTVWIKRAFALFLAITAIRMLRSALG
ncbi:sulfite exporter TauE/SafE family protein [Tropicimonas sp. IMCC34043]|uniref:sulfite exporter TauE/SafE family protein n=1 Tax=Tropicimonas sp. IMCC34043 TaxID=2248760 RepID=UPI000E27919D|nr:sulfite exporter TauE/SafE family protein [Tropicimonas sp. IMCC34043]